MQDFDFGKYYKNNRNSITGDSRRVNKEEGSPWTRKLSIIGAIISVSFFLGMYTGVTIKQTKVIDSNSPLSFEEGQADNNILSDVNSRIPKDSNANVEKLGQNKHTQSELAEKLQSKDAEFIILAKMYSSKEKAHYHGLQLQKQGFPVFLAENGNKMKLYVGPISGKKSAYSTLAQVKGVAEFKSAIMYQK